MLYGLLVTGALIAAGFWIHLNYRTKNVSSNTRIHWHRLIANNVYLAVVKMPTVEWQIEISITPDDSKEIIINVDNDKKHVTINVANGASLELLKEAAKDNKEIDRIVRLFLTGMIEPSRVAPLFPNPKDYEVYKELVFYLGTSLDRT